MLPLKNRLLGKNLPFIKSSGKKLHTPFFKLIYLPRPHQATRIAFIVSKKQTPKAVDRNRLKRQLRHLALRHINIINTGLDIIIYPKGKLNNTPFKQLSREIKNTFTKLAVTKPNQ